MEKNSLEHIHACTRPEIQKLIWFVSSSRSLLKSVIYQNRDTSSFRSNYVSTQSSSFQNHLAHVSTFQQENPTSVPTVSFFEWDGSPQLCHCPTNFSQCKCIHRMNKVDVVHIVPRMYSRTKKCTDWPFLSPISTNEFPGAGCRKG